MEKPRKLATIRRIKEIHPIENADAIELAVVDGWKSIIKKGEYQPGDWCVYCEIDSFLPIRPEFEFLRKSSYKKLPDGTEGFRLKSMRMRGELSQGLILPLNILEGDHEDEKLGYLTLSDGSKQYQLGPYDNSLVIEDGLDITELLGITKYEPPIPAELSGKVKGRFPSFIRKTDEERVQNLTKEYETWKKDKHLKRNFYVSEKIVGSSSTFYYNNGEFGVCSRNLELSDPGEFRPGTIIGKDGVERPKKENTFWKVAREANIHEKLAVYNGNTGRNIAVQGELIGEGIEKNPYNIRGHEVRIFNVFDIDEQQYFPLNHMIAFTNFILYMKTVPILNIYFRLPNTVNELLEFANGKSALNTKINREGIVIRSMDMNISFKVISNQFLLENE